MLRSIIGLVTKYKGMILYIIFGALTTFVNYLIYFPLYFSLSLSAVLSNAIAWAGAVLFAFLTNKPFVFESKDWSIVTTFRELLSFVGCRIMTGLLETVAIFIFVDLLDYNGFVWKIVVSVAVVILNYVLSRVFVFNKKISDTPS